MQPSELAKPALIVFLAFFVTWKAPAINNRRYTLIPAAVAVGFVLLMIVVADLGTAVVLGLTATVIFFVAGLEWRYFATVAGIAAVGVLICILVQPYRLVRVVHFFDPEFKITARFDPKGTIRAHMEKSLATRDPNYQVEQAKMGIGSGGLAGLGLIGAAGLLIGFGLIFWRGMRAALRMGDDFGRYLALGVTVVVVVQGMINMSVVLGLMPTKGIPLPMISYGGSSLLSTLALLGILMNVAEHAG